MTPGPAPPPLSRATASPTVAGPGAAPAAPGAAAARAVPGPRRDSAADDDLFSAQAADGAETAEPAADADAAADEPEEAAGSRTRSRRRRSGRGRGRADAAGQDATNAGADGEGDAAAQPDDTAGSDGADDSAADGDEDGGELTAAGRRRRRKRRRGGADGDVASPDDPPDTVVHVREPHNPADDVQPIKGSTRLEAKKQRRREGREHGRRRAPIITEAEFLARREAVERVDGRPAARRPHPDRRAGGRRARRALRRTAGRTPPTSATSTWARCRTCCRRWRPPSSTSARAATPCCTPVRSTSTRSAWNGQSARIESALKSGQPILVQVTKDPIGHKGARLTSQVSPARPLPRLRARRLDDRHQPQAARHRAEPAEDDPQEDRPRRTPASSCAPPPRARARTSWAATSSGCRPVGGHREEGQDGQRAVAAVRRAGHERPGRPRHLQRGLHQVSSSGDDGWDTIDELRRARRARPGRPARALDAGDGDVFATYRIDEQLAKALDRKVWLPCGGSLVIDRTEAMTVVDVNTGKFTGSGRQPRGDRHHEQPGGGRGDRPPAPAARLGGIIVIDFIDMVLESNRDLVLRRLLECLGRDRTKHQVAEVTSLGLVQMTRKRVGAGPAGGVLRALRALQRPRRDPHARAAGARSQLDRRAPRRAAGAGQRQRPRRQGQPQGNGRGNGAAPRATGDRPARDGARRARGSRERRRAPRQRRRRPRPPRPRGRRRGRGPPRRRRDGRTTTAAPSGRGDGRRRSPVATAGHRRGRVPPP